MKKFTALFLSVILLTAIILPLTASAAESRIYVAGIELKSGEYLANGADAPTDVCPEGTGYAHYDNGILTLNNFSYEGIGSVDSDEHSLIYSEGELALNLVGENSLISDIDAAPSYHYWIGIKCDSTLKTGGYGSLYIYGDYGIFVSNKEGDVTFALSESTLDIEARETGIYLSASNKKSNTYAYFFDGEVNIDSGTSGIEAYAYINVYLYTSGSEINIDTEDSVNIYSLGEQYFYVTGGKMTANNVIIASIIGNLEDSHIIVESGELICWSLGDMITLGEKIEAVVLDDGRMSYREKAIPLGDVNADYTVDQFDYILIKRHYFETRYLTDDELPRADVNADGVIDQFDYILIKRIYFGTYTIE